METKKEEEGFVVGMGVGFVVNWVNRSGWFGCNDNDCSSVNKMNRLTQLDAAGSCNRAGLVMAEVAPISDHLLRARNRPNCQMSSTKSPRLFYSCCTITPYDTVRTCRVSQCAHSFINTRGFHSTHKAHQWLRRLEQKPSVNIIPSQISQPQDFNLWH